MASGSWIATFLQNLSGDIKQGQIVVIFSGFNLHFQRKNVKYDLTAETVSPFAIEHQKILIFKTILSFYCVFF